MLEMIKDLGMRHNGVRNYRWALYRCPKCNKEIERMKHQGDNQEQCQECFREYHRSTQTKHGGRYKRLYRTWINMRQRCFNKNHKLYSQYGERGITVCEEWSDYKSFEEFAIKNGYNDTLTIDRINVDGDYEPSNCQFITMSENAKKDKHRRIGMTHKLSVNEKTFMFIENMRESNSLSIVLEHCKVSYTAYRNAKRRYSAR